MNYSGIKYADMINGKGIRVSLFVSGCTHACKNCFNEETWKETYGKKFTEKEEDEIIEYFKKYGKTLSQSSLEYLVGHTDRPISSIICNSRSSKLAVFSKSCRALFKKCA